MRNVECGGPAVTRQGGRARSLLPELPRDVWLLQGAGLVSQVGGSLTLPFVLIYLHNVRGFSLALAGLMWALVPGVGIVVGFLGGAATDRFGAKPLIVLGALGSAAGWLVMAVAGDAWTAFAACAVLGSAGAVGGPARSALLAECAGPRLRHRAFSLEFAATNLALAVGGIVGGLVADTARPETFTVLFALNAATSFALVAVLPAIRAGAGPRRGASSPPGSYRHLLGHPALLGLVGSSLLFMFAVLSWEVGFAPLAKNAVGLDESAIGFVLAANAIAVVVLQLPLARLLEGRRRMRALSVSAVVWIGALAASTAAAAWLDPRAALGVFVLAAVAIAAGECVVSPAQGALVADLAPEHLRGRAFALSRSSFMVGASSGTAWVGLVLALEPLALWPVAAVVAAAAGIAALALERRMPAELRRLPHSDRSGAERAAETGAEPLPAAA